MKILRQKNYTNFNFKKAAKEIEESAKRAAIRRNTLQEISDKAEKTINRVNTDLTPSAKKLKEIVKNGGKIGKTALYSDHSEIKIKPFKPTLNNPSSPEYTGKYVSGDTTGQVVTSDDEYRSNQPVEYGDVNEEAEDYNNYNEDEETEGENYYD